MALSSFKGLFEHSSVANKDDYRSALGLFNINLNSVLTLSQYKIYQIGPSDLSCFMTPWMSNLQVETKQSSRYSLHLVLGECYRLSCCTLLDVAPGIEHRPHVTLQMFQPSLPSTHDHCRIASWAEECSHLQSF